MISARTLHQIWERYERFCKARQLDPFSNVGLAVWTYDISAEHDDEFVLPPEVEIIEDILSAAGRRG